MPSPSAPCPLSLTWPATAASLGGWIRYGRQKVLFPGKAKEMNTSISVSSRHIKAEYHWGKKAVRCIVKFKEDVIAK